MSNCIDCPDEQNYAAIALQMQQTALGAEECLYALQTQMRQGYNPSTLVMASSALEAPPANVMWPLTSSGTAVYSNFNVSNFIPAWPQGVWQVGAWLNATASGAVNAQTIRELYVTVRGATDAPAVASRYEAAVTVQEPNNGLGVDMVVNTTVVIGPNEVIRFFFRHGNTSSALNIAAGATYWATRLSDSTALRVV